MIRDPDEPRFWVPYPWVIAPIAIGVLVLWVVRWMVTGRWL